METETWKKSPLQTLLQDFFLLNHTPHPGGPDSFPESISKQFSEQHRCWNIISFKDFWTLECLLSATDRLSGISLAKSGKNTQIGHSVSPLAQESLTLLCSEKVNLDKIEYKGPRRCPFLTGRSRGQLTLSSSDQPESKTGAQHEKKERCYSHYSLTEGWGRNLIAATIARSKGKGCSLLLPSDKVTHNSWHPHAAPTDSVCKHQKEWVSIID